MLHTRTAQTLRSALFHFPHPDPIIMSFANLAETAVPKAPRKMYTPDFNEDMLNLHMARVFRQFFAQVEEKVHRNRRKLKVHAAFWSATSALKRTETASGQRVSGTLPVDVRNPSLRHNVFHEPNIDWRSSFSNATNPRFPYQSMIFQASIPTPITGGSSET